MTNLLRVLFRPILPCLGLLAAVGAAGPQEPDGPRVLAGSPGVPAARIRTVERLLPGALAQLRGTFPAANRPFTVRVHESLDTLPESARRNLHPGTPGLALLQAQEIHLILDEVERRPPNDLRTVLLHEIVHVLLHQEAGPAAGQVPRWLHEGLAQVLSGDTYLGSREEDLLYPAHLGRLFRFADLRADFPDDDYGRRQAYAQSFSFVGFLCRELSVGRVVDAARECTPGDWFAGGFLATTGSPLVFHVSRWEDYLRSDSGAAYRFLFKNCFAYLMILGFVLLALAGIRRWNRDLKHRQKLEREDLVESEDNEDLGP